MAERHWEGRIPPHLAGRRLDQALAELVPGVSRAEVQRLIREGHCSVDDRGAKAGERVAEGMQVVLDITEPQSTTAPERAPLAALCEDEQLIVVNKPAGMASHPAKGSPTGTLLNALVGHLADADLPESRGCHRRPDDGTRDPLHPTPRPTLVHRLDRDTSGAILAAKTVAAHRDLKRQMDGGLLRRTYWALVWGDVAGEEGKVDQPLDRARGDKTRMAVTPDGKRAVTHWRVLRRLRVGQASSLSPVGQVTRPVPAVGQASRLSRVGQASRLSGGEAAGPDEGHGSRARGRRREASTASAEDGAHTRDSSAATLLEVRLETGRTHQIRVHMEWLGHPLVGERVYRGGRGELTEMEKRLSGQALHSRCLEFCHPTSGERMVVVAESPEEWREVIPDA